MTNTKSNQASDRNNQSSKNKDEHSQKTSASGFGKGRGFASQPKEKVWKAARKGGRHSHGRGSSSHH